MCARTRETRNEALSWLECVEVVFVPEAAVVSEPVAPYFERVEGPLTFTQSALVG
jgi:hypothetical protein